VYYCVVLCFFFDVRLSHLNKDDLFTYFYEYCRNECLDGATPCGSITVSRTNNGQLHREGLYEIQSSENSSRCNGRPVWKSTLIDSWIYYSAADAAWCIANVDCGNTALSCGTDFLAFEVLLSFLNSAGAIGFRQ